MIGCPNARGCIFKTADVMIAAVEGWERDGARCQMQELTAPKSHGLPPT